MQNLDESLDLFDEFLSSDFGRILYNLTGKYSFKLNRCNSNLIYDNP